MPIPLEDQLGDVIGKARRGLRLTEAQLAQNTGVSLENVEAFAQGRLLDDPETAAKVSRALELYAPALLDLGRGEYEPGDVAAPPTFAAFNAPYGDDMTVNFYLAWDHEGGRGVAFDTGGDCSALLEALRERKLTLAAIFLSHTHEDHIADLDRLTAETDAPVYVSEREPLRGANAVHDGQEFKLGGLTVTARLTPGHSPGGLTYVIAGLEPMVAVVGDGVVCGVDGRRAAGQVRGGAGREPRTHFHVAGRNDHLPRPRADDDRGLRASAQSVLRAGRETAGVEHFRGSRGRFGLAATATECRGYSMQLTDLSNAFIAPLIWVSCSHGTPLPCLPSARQRSAVATVGTNTAYSIALRSRQRLPPTKKRTIQRKGVPRFLGARRTRKTTPRLLEGCSSRLPRYRLG